MTFSKMAVMTFPIPHAFPEPCQSLRKVNSLILSSSETYLDRVKVEEIACEFWVQVIKGKVTTWLSLFRFLLLDSCHHSVRKQTSTWKNLYRCSCWYPHPAKGASYDPASAAMHRKSEASHDFSHWSLSNHSSWWLMKLSWTVSTESYPDSGFVSSINDRFCFKLNVSALIWGMVVT